MTSKQLKSEIALRCGDPEFKDFEPQIYDRAIYRCNREIAKFYGIFQKTMQFILREMVGDVQEEIALNMPDFKSEYLVDVNGIELIKVANRIIPEQRGVYYMEFREGTWYFNYSMGVNASVTGINISGQDITETMSQDLFERIEDGLQTNLNKSMDDEITICYSIIPDLDSEIGEYDIPTKFEEEQIEKAMYYMGKLGLAKYPGQNEKNLKYQTIVQMYKSEKRSEYDKNIAKDSEWVKMIPWSVI